MKLSGYQLFWMTSISSMIMFSYIPITIAVNEARQDAWISILLGDGLMMAVTWLMLRVCMQNRDKTLVKMMKDLLGTVAGKIVVTAYFVHWFLQMSTTVKDMANFQNLVMLHNTPMSAVLLCMLFLVFYAVYKGGDHGGQPMRGGDRSHLHPDPVRAVVP
ncbi:GerAB/ArcD/ProY family transporter [Cohnella rhizosphaerae]|uniref:GerAB/ArcD/ProY family transporter n=1 Tax=Cohnella rhizosphaerae TaxID=1457232 RepID=A0A9X4QSS7_9BACL|nr:GerAB/ArcD/ProY family transporter [Cohnella rhizosphaerae]MDG0809890.1 GerAB/ArcD/ProY family transporter [Cohnella rhizosphaerae]